MENDVLVKVEGVSKKFCIDLKTSLWYGLKDLTTNVFGNKKERKLRDKEFWALRDINFELKRGECLGLIGHNGAGKSTLLKILNGLIKPDEGKVTIKGNVGALIELGAGFNPILSGRENIYNNGAVLGFSKEEIDNKVEEIIDFAEIREFIDMPVQNYSSGMKVRLGFAVAAQMEPDVLIIDEVLAVGDVSFRAKCFNILETLMKKCVVIIVSHSMPQIARICTSIILLQRGKRLFYKKNSLGQAIEAYYGLVGDINESKIGNGKVKIKNIIINNVEEKENYIDYNSSLEIKLNLNIIEKINELSIRITFFDAEQKPVAQISSQNDNKKIVARNNIEIGMVVERFFLNIGSYNVHIAIHEVTESDREGEVLQIIRSAAKVVVGGNSYYSHAPCLFEAIWDV